MAVKLLLKEIRAVLPDGDGVQLSRCDIGVEGGGVAFVGQAPPEFAPDKVIDGSKRLVMPGLINAHTHAYMTLFRNRADDLPFRAWLFDRILPMEDRLRPGDSYWGAMLACCEMLRSGTTCYNDMPIFSPENARAALDSGMRAVIGRGLVGEGYDDPGGLRRLGEAEAEIAEYRGCGEGRLRFMLAPHAPYTCAPAYLRRVIETARRLGVGIHTHLGESRGEIAGLKEQYQQTPFEYMEAAGLFALPTVAAHCVYMTENDMAIAARHGVSVATNPVSNLKLANGVAPVPKMLKAGINVALGTDGAASNNSLNMLRELGYLCLLHKGWNEDPESLPAARGIFIATMGGAKALGLADQVGSIEPGKRADLTILNLEQSHWYPHSDLLGALCYGAQGGEVETVLVNGEILLENGSFTKLDEERVRYEAQRVSDRVCGG
ncbi:MAG: amidohydrolase [Oscillospiraceae bacterium]|jgi:5-methylthioadenosine/S-adenosylhomocysteine deaminase|nr:amidohydrolase [Oscillospiraceae bacterium]